MSSSAKTVEFRIKPHRLSTSADLHLFSFYKPFGGSDYNQSLILESYTGGDI